MPACCRAARATRLACPLFERLAGIGVPVLVVAEYDPYHWQNDDYARSRARPTTRCWPAPGSAGLATLDLFPTIDEGVRKQGLWTIYGRAHPGPAGTELAARRIAEEVQKLHIPPRAVTDAIMAWATTCPRR